MASITIYKFFHCTLHMDVKTCMHAFQPFNSTFMQINIIALNDNKQVAKMKTMLTITKPCMGYDP